ncbi:MAG: T9SS type A sorting domain-containing protein [Sphingobacteriales bacterium]|nr:MAG: T9SS type A sorting domain-containing protein [Sphingobacteriales bacterium]
MNKKHLKTIILTLFALTTYIQFSYAQRIAAGGWHSVVVCSDKTVKAFGENATGELGDGTNNDQSEPVTVTGLSDIIAVSAGGDQLEAHSMALKNDGTVWAWGSNLYGGLGNGSTINTNVPVQTLLLNNIIAISAGGWHSVALKDDGTVWTWGWNIDGQLGDGTLNDRILPGMVNGLSDITAISAGTYHVLALKVDGTVWAWGDNISGQIGDGTNIDRTIPVQVVGLTDVVKIAAGRFFSLAVKSDGTVWAWGENLYGQLGDGTTTDKTLPVQVVGLSGVTSAVAATGAFHCMAVKNDNTVWAWGRNTYGNLGDGTLDHQSTPVLMLDISDVEGMAAGTNFSLVYKYDGTFWGCGRNASGQLGDGTFLQRNTLTQSTLVCPITDFTGVEDNLPTSNNDILIYPNPASDFITIEVHEKTTLNLLDLQGRLLKSLHLTNNAKKVDLSNLNQGIYLLELKNEKETVVKKVYKQ